MSLLFAATLFVSAALVFFVEPMVARMVLPLLGGTPAVWNASMVFFQAALLAAYGYAHLVSSLLRPRAQVVLHGCLLFVPLVVVPIAVPAWAHRTLPYETNPLPWLLGLLLAGVGLPFFVTAAGGSLLQRWFARTGHPSAADPYFLYAASNLGSLLALLSYPLAWERNWTLEQQSKLWAAGYGCFIALTLLCAAAVWRSSAKRVGGPPSSTPEGTGAPPSSTDPPLSARRRLRWIGLAFVPSSLMLGVTSYLSTDIAAIPLLWVLPLSVYLATFILTFARRQFLPAAWMGRLLAVGALVLTVLLVCTDMQPPLYVLIPLHLLTLFAAGMVCHGELAQDRPPVRHLTEFYLWLAAGGVLGGLFNAVVAPLVFNDVLEYPLVLVAACLFRLPVGEYRRTMRSRLLDYALPAGLGLLTAGLILGVQAHPAGSRQLGIGLMLGLPAVLAYTFVDRPFRFALGLAAFLIAGCLYTGLHGQTLYAHRSFFGVLRVTEDPTHTFVQIVHGNTVHGRQRRDSKQCDPLAYYHRTGPVGQLFEALDRRKAGAPRRVAVVGLGAGSLACYAEPGQEWTFYEIDPAVEPVARKYFTFLKQCRAPVKVIPGDARLRLREAPDGRYGVIVLDAFSSDAIPVHLLTREALNLYQEKLARDGVIAVHVSNRYLDLKPVVGNLARDAGLVCLAQEDVGAADQETAAGKEPSEWAVMARHEEDLGRISRNARWYPVEGNPRQRVWTDDFSNLLRAFKWE